MRKVLSGVLVFLILFSETYAGVIKGDNVFTRSAVRGYKPVEQLNIFHKVISIDENNGYCESLVKRMIKLSTHYVILITTRTGVLSLVREAKIYCANKDKYINVLQLEKGDYILNNGLRPVEVLDIKEINAPESVKFFVLALEKPNNYFVADSVGVGYLVHNNPTFVLIDFVVNNADKTKEIAIEVAKVAPFIAGGISLVGGAIIGSRSVFTHSGRAKRRADARLEEERAIAAQEETKPYSEMTAEEFYSKSRPPEGMSEKEWEEFKKANLPSTEESIKESARVYYVEALLSAVKDGDTTLLSQLSGLTEYELKERIALAKKEKADKERSKHNKRQLYGPNGKLYRGEKTPNDPGSDSEGEGQETKIPKDNSKKKDESLKQKAYKAVKDALKKKLKSEVTGKIKEKAKEKIKEAIDKSFQQDEPITDPNYILEISGIDLLDHTLTTPTSTFAYTQEDEARHKDELENPSQLPFTRDEVKEGLKVVADKIVDEINIPLPGVQAVQSIERPSVPEAFFQPQGDTQKKEAENSLLSEQTLRQDKFDMNKTVKPICIIAEKVDGYEAPDEGGFWGGLKTFFNGSANFRNKERVIQEACRLENKRLACLPEQEASAIRVKRKLKLISHLEQERDRKHFRKNSYKRYRSARSEPRNTERFGSFTESSRFEFSPQTPVFVSTRTATGSDFGTDRYVPPTFHSIAGRHTMSCIL